MRVIDTWQTAPPSDDSEQGGLELTQSAHLRILAGSCSQPAYPVEMQGLSIGREECDVVIRDDPRISRKHARVERSFAGWQFQDLGSRNGFYVNGRGFGRGQRTPLPDGSVIRIGDSVMVFRTAPLPSDPRVDSAVFPRVSPEAANVRRRIDELAASFGHVLILGDTGTGKESVAKAIGAQRSPHPFVTLNCAQLNREMARSELFGHVRGAFTNAVSTRPGLVDLAGEGALFLDEIGDLPLDVQAELLRFLEDGSYRALGSTDLRKSAARVVAATNIDLDRAVHQSLFRRDLLARLRATNTPLTLPPLRERRDDILGWTQLFLRLRGRDPGPRPWGGCVGVPAAVSLAGEPARAARRRELRGGPDPGAAVRALAAAHGERACSRSPGARARACVAAAAGYFWSLWASMYTPARQRCQSASNAAGRAELVTTGAGGGRGAGAAGSAAAT